jgi:hypothetical protein
MTYTSQVVDEHDVTQTADLMLSREHTDVKNYADGHPPIKAFAQAMADKEILDRALPLPLPEGYEWDVIYIEDEAGRAGRQIGIKRKAGTKDAAPAETGLKVDELLKMTQKQLAEMAVRMGDEHATDKETKARLVERIKKLETKTK